MLDTTVLVFGVDADSFGVNVPPVINDGQLFELEEGKVRIELGDHCVDSLSILIDEVQEQFHINNNSLLVTEHLYHNDRALTKT